VEIIKAMKADRINISAGSIRKVFLTVIFLAAVTIAPSQKNLGSISESRQSDPALFSLFKLQNHEPVEGMKKSASEEFAGWIEVCGTDMAIEKYRALRQDLPEGYYLSETEINTLGQSYYELMKDFKTAKAILLQNVFDYPGSYKVYDSMGWLCRQVNDLDQASEWYLMGLQVYERAPDQNKRWIKDVENAKQWLKYTLTSSLYKNQ
jgi:tetratricopeptide (TPR) repeat protein